MDANQKKDISEALGALQLTFRRNVNSHLAAGGITRPQMLVLRELIFSNGLNLKDLSDRMGLSHSTVSGIVDRLERRRLVRRERDRKDRRVTRIFVTEPVLRNVDKMRDNMYEPIISAIAAAPPEEQAKITAGLAALRKLFGKERRP